MRFLHFVTKTIYSNDCWRNLSTVTRGANAFISQSIHQLTDVQLIANFLPSLVTSSPRLWNVGSACNGIYPLVMFVAQGEPEGGIGLKFWLDLKLAATFIHTPRCRKTCYAFSRRFSINTFMFGVFKLDLCAVYTNFKASFKGEYLVYTDISKIIVEKCANQLGAVT